MVQIIHVFEIKNRVIPILRLILHPIYSIHLQSGKKS